MSTLRKLFEEALMEKKKGPPGTFKRGYTDVVSYINDKRAKGDFKGNPWHDSVTGRFSSNDGDIALRGGSMSMGDKFRKAKKSGKGAKWKNTTDGAGRNSGSGKYFSTTFGRQKKSRGPSPNRVLAHSGKLRKDGGSKPGYSDEKQDQLANLVGPQRAAEIFAKKKAGATKKEQGRLAAAGKGLTAPRKVVKRGASNRKKGKRGSAGGDMAYGGSMAYGEAEDLFMNRLLEGSSQDEHPLSKIDRARFAVAEALEALADVPDAEDYEEIMESAEALAQVWDSLNYED